MPEHEPWSVVVGDDGVARCWWGTSTPDYAAYHDEEWGYPVSDDRRLFEKLCLEGFQSGLSWLTILRKREGFREAFHGFDPERVAAMGDADIERLLGNAEIVRHGGKIRSTVNNAARVIEVAEQHGSLAAYIWTFEPDEGPPSQQSTSPESTALAKDLKRRGFTFVGPTTVYAFMQAMGMVNDHLEACDTRDGVAAARQGFARPQ